MLYRMKNQVSAHAEYQKVEDVDVHVDIIFLD